MIQAPLLTLVASYFIGFNTPVYCNFPFGSDHWVDGIVGEVFYDSNRKNPWRIYLRYCPYPLENHKEATSTLAHEMLHVMYPFRSELWVLQHEHAFGTVVGRKLKRLRRGNG